MKISVVGLGKLGLCTATYFASKGHKVIGVEKDRCLIDKLKERKCPIKETGLSELLSVAWDNFEVTEDLAQAVCSTEATLIIVPTPSLPDGRFSNQYLETVLREIGPVLGSKAEFHVVDVVSTVMPGSCGKVFKPLLEELSGKSCGRDFGLVYNPEFIALGSVIRDFARPDMVLIGASDRRSAAVIEQLYVSSCENEPHIAGMSLINAEITKLSLNCFVTTKISFANELSNICERVPGADVDAITEAIGSDSRVGGKYLRGGLGFGGTCFPRDNIAFHAFTNELDYDAKLSKATVAVNDGVVDKLYAIITENTAPGGRVGLLGLSYKPHTHIIEQSQSVDLAGRLAEGGYEVNVFDPAALDSAKEALAETVSYCCDPYQCASACDAVVLLTPWPEFKNSDWQRIDKETRAGAILVDSWRQLKDKSFVNMRYVGLGLGASKEPAGVL